MFGVGFSIPATALRYRAIAQPGPQIMTLDFTGGALPQGVSVARSSTATYFGSDGVMKTASANVARLDHNRTTFASRGLLIESATSNLISHSRDLSNAAWVRNSVTVNADVDTAPDGTLVNGLDFGSGYAYHDISVTPGIAYTASFWIKANKVCTIGVRAAGTATGDTVPIVLDTVWKRISVTHTPASASPKFLLENRSGQGYGVTGLKVFVMGVQVEPGAKATSLIQTNGTIGTRAADMPSVTGVNGVYDVRVTYDNGTTATYLTHNVSDGWWPVQSHPWVTSIAFHPQGTLN